MEPAGLTLGLFLSGFSLILLQLVLNWHLGPVLHSSELPWLLLCCTALLGQGLGYSWGVRKWPALSLTVTLSAPLLVAALRSLHLSPWGNLAATAILSTSASFGLSQLISSYWQNRAGASLIAFYRIELAGAINALLLAFLLGPVHSTQVFPWAVLLAAWSLRTGPARLALAGLAALNSLGFTWASWQAARSDYADGRILAQQVSPFQYVEVVENRLGRFLFLNGLCHYGPSVYNQLNLYLTQLPAELLPSAAREKGCLVIGAGTFVAPAMAASQGLTTTVIELDPAVVELGLEHFRKERPQRAPFRVLTGDVRRLLPDQGQFGLVVVNLPAPYSLNVASLFTREFFLALRGKLTPDGFCTVYLGAPLEGAVANPAQGPILAAVLAAFPDVLAISSTNCQNTILIGSSRPVGDVRDWRSHLRRHGQNRFTLFSRSQLVEIAQNFSPSSLDDLRMCAAFNQFLWQEP